MRLHREAAPGPCPSPRFFADAQREAASGASPPLPLPGFAQEKFEEGELGHAAEDDVANVFWRHVERLAPVGGDGDVRGGFLSWSQAVGKARFRD